MIATHCLRQSSAFDAWVEQHDDMSVSAAHASAFYAEAGEHQCVWGIRDGHGFPAPLNGDGERAMPFWSLRSRAERVVSTVRPTPASRWSRYRSMRSSRVGCRGWSEMAFESGSTGLALGPPDTT